MYHYHYNRFPITTLSHNLHKERREEREERGEGRGRGETHDAGEEQPTTSTPCVLQSCLLL